MTTDEHTETVADENGPVLDLIAEALEPYDIPTGAWSDDERLEPARAVLDALGLEVGVAMIAAERKRQIEAEGWTPEHDDEHSGAEMTQAAVAYAFHAVGQVNGVCWPDEEPDVPPSWPWHMDWWKPSDDPTRNLVRAGALIAAEIDRLQRAATCSPT